MAKVVTYKNGAQLLICPLTKEQEREFYGGPAPAR
jgi:hypothetical protein